MHQLLKDSSQEGKYNKYNMHTSKILFNLFINEGMPGRCYNLFKGESEKDMYISDQKCWGKNCS